MPSEVTALLWDIVEAAEFAEQSIEPLTLDQYADSRLVQSGVERSLEIVGEALRQLSKTDPIMVQRDPILVQRIEGYQGFIGLRNVIAHQYSVLEHDVLWGTVRRALPDLRRQVESVLRDQVAQDKNFEGDEN